MSGVPVRLPDGRAERAPVADLIDLRWQVLRAGRPRSTAQLSDDAHPDTRHWVWRAPSGTVVGVASVMPAPWPGVPEGADAVPPAVPWPGPRWQLRGMATHPDHRGIGLGTALLRAVHAEVDAPMWCNARVRAVPFYVRAGWAVRTTPFDVPAIGPHRRLTWHPEARRG